MNFVGKVTFYINISFTSFFTFSIQPTESEKETYDEAEAFLKDCETLLEQLKSFKGTNLFSFI